ncbi:hypothetical protein BU26DRAFT_149992 [Trematosphaeria pertusa]|uniref:Uncharacterized protein n=1 Tax=Trematosphaeria pertusa TaxID=390896 RepID=A0A6A6IWV3_9PLEO|nr:uncharacterized protein BU26DRAFT_149992 [Trematosphaeria pertusa]KAF2255035.1 hypothetical protein BU26DRAFT_149992 [Trematosphaeria pertusa]
MGRVAPFRKWRVAIGSKVIRFSTVDNRLRAYLGGIIIMVQCRDLVGSSVDGGALGRKQRTYSNMTHRKTSTIFSGSGQHSSFVCIFQQQQSRSAVRQLVAVGLPDGLTSAAHIGPMQRW